MNNKGFVPNDIRYFSTFEEFIEGLAEEHFGKGEAQENYMYGNHIESDDDSEYDIYGENYCLVQFSDHGLCDMYGKPWETMVTTADFDIGSIRNEGVTSLSFNNGVLCDISPHSVFSITRLSESEYMEACEMLDDCMGVTVHLVI